MIFEIEIMIISYYYLSLPFNNYIKIFVHLSKNFVFLIANFPITLIACLDTIS